VRINHRGRLTLVAAGTSGVLFLILFAVSAFALRRAEFQAALNELEPAISQVRSDVNGPEGRPDLTEVVQANPSISLAIYDLHGRLLDSDGKESVPNIASPQIEGDLVVKSDDVKGIRIVAGIQWKRHQELIERFEELCAILWLPLVGVVALATWLVARATFTPLERLTSDAAAMSVTDLSKRLETNDVGEYRAFVIQLNGFLDRLEESIRREERFLSDAAHELRTPLTVLRGEIETTLRSERPADEYRKTLSILADETTRLTNLVELLLQTAAPTQGSLATSDLSQLIDRVHARWVDRFQGQGVILHLDGHDVAATLPEAEFDVVLDNLLANALRVSPQDSACSVAVLRDKGGIRVVVADEGPGVPAEEVERIFERFARGDSSRARSHGGFGIGLSLCKRIVEAWGGRIRVEPNEPKGARFVIELPAPENPLS